MAEKQTLFVYKTLVELLPNPETPSARYPCENNNIVATSNICKVGRGGNGRRVISIATVEPNNSCTKLLSSPNVRLLPP